MTIFAFIASVYDSIDVMVLNYH